MNKTPPQTWYWGRLNDFHAPARKAIGYYYIDKSGGRSFHVVVDVTNGASDAASIKRIASECNYRGELTMRLGAHEEVFVDNMSPDDAAYMREEFEDATYPVKVRIMRLTKDERASYGLPDFPDWAQFYL